MRRIILFAVAALFINYAQAQFKPVGKDFCIELQFFPFGNPVIMATGDNYDVGGTNVPVFGISPRFFLTEKMELKVDLQFSAFSTKNKVPVPAGGNGVEEVTVNSMGGFGLNFGLNYHFKGTERISPYVGAMFGFGIANTHTKVTGLNHVQGDSRNDKAGTFGLGFDLVTGFNWYIVKGLYIGAEVDLGVGFAKPLKTSTSTTVGGVTNANTVNPTSSRVAFAFTAGPALRLGWKF